MGRRKVLFLCLVFLAAILVWQLPALLRAIPSRYVAAYVPESVQAFAIRDRAEILPTAAVEVDAVDLLTGPDFQVGANDEIVTPSPLPPPVLVKPSNDERVPAAAQEVAPTETPLPVPSAAPTVTPVPLPSAARLSSFSHQFQTWNNCGPATLAMGLSYFGLYLTQSQTAATLKPNPEDRNVSPYEMVAYVNGNTEFTAVDRTNGSLDTLRRLLANGFPVMVELGIDPPGEYRWMGWYGHYLLLVAYDDVSQQVWVYDSWFGTSEVPGENADPDGRIVSYDDLDRYWQQFNRTYIVLYRTEEASQVAAIIGPSMDDSVMWRESLIRNQRDLAADPENAFLWFNLGTTYVALGDYESSAASFDKARELGLPWRMLWYQFGPYEAYYQVGRHEDVILLANVTLKDRPYFEEAFYYKGLAQEAIGETKEARSNIEQAVRFNPNFALAVEALDRLSS